MDVFEIHQQLIDDYRQFTEAAIEVRDGAVREHVRLAADRGEQWPAPFISLNPSFESGGSITDLVTQGVLHQECLKIFRIKQSREDQGSRTLTLHRHQTRAIEAARSRLSYVLTTGTGSGKSLGYIIPIVDRVLRLGSAPGIKAIIVYPMNALANSQVGELEKFLDYGYGLKPPKAWGAPPVTYARYTGQERAAERKRILNDPPDILLTNYMMLEYLLTRPEERSQIVSAAQGLKFLVLDELHTYRGRQGADVALLVRRVREACNASDLQCVGTSATMATEGSAEQRRAAIADVATRLFGTEVTTHRVIGETLERATDSEPPSLAELATAVHQPARSGTYDGLAHDPLSRWVESRFGLDFEEGEGLVRRDPTTVVDAARELAKQIGRPDSDFQEMCAKAIRAALDAGSRVKHPETERPLFAFRLHQFLSKGDTVYVSLEPEKAPRYLTSQYQTAVPGHPDRPLYPLVFCRNCGHEYLSVDRVRQADGGHVFLPRGAVDPDDHIKPGYLFINDRNPWPDTIREAIQQNRIPDHWLESPDDGPLRVMSRLESYLPRAIWAQPDGVETTAPGSGTPAAFIARPFRICLNCKATWEQTRGSDFAKVVGLDVEGRSSAVSVVSASIVRALDKVRDSDPDFDKARKLLTFVDNRQDASLQAGHFNDFIQVTQLRGALYHAVDDTGRDGLEFDGLAQQVAAQMRIPFADFAANPTARFGQKDATVQVFRQVIAHRLLCDLERGWRITMPNLEQTGLLRIEYAWLDEVAQDGVWQDGLHPKLAALEWRQRKEILHVLLDVFRKNLAISVDLLNPDGFERLQTRSDQYLAGPWALAPNSPLRQPAALYARPAAPGGSRSSVHVTGRSRFGQYLEGELGRLSLADRDLIIRQMIKVLADEMLTEVDEGGYQLNASVLRWKQGKGERAAPDPLNFRADNEFGARVNPYFRDLYRTVGDSLAALHAEEHTAQVNSDTRRAREEAFAEARLKLLYCSPTMELGVDIKRLAAVGMRNVPPTPANYAQRSGRAGRAGQPALIATYCANGNAHDHYYFRRPELMVSGKVAPPRLDLANEDLLRSHVHALWLAETGMSLGTAMQDVLQAEGSSPSLDVRLELAAALADPAAAERAVDRARSIVAGFADTLKAATWWHEQWIEETARRAPHVFNRACDRWRGLYRAALQDRQEQNDRWMAASGSSRARDRAAARRREAETQIKLLRCEEAGIDSGFSDFYTYRYFASEGFLPGYAFPRLPLAAYIPGTRGYRRGDYIQRPRFIAVNEFGPGALIYHEGDRYQVTRIQVPIDEPGEVATGTVRICESCGYLHDAEGKASLCENCGAGLSRAKHNLMRMQTVFTTRRARISSDEEERRRAGFDLLTSYHFSDHGARSGRADADAVAGGLPLARLTYGDTATVRVVNLGHRRGKGSTVPDGFFLDLVGGRWLKESDGEGAGDPDSDLPDAEDAQYRKRVIPYVEDRRNILVFRFAESVPDETATSLQYALERGIEARFQLEDSELTSERLPDADRRGRILFTESAEGGAGVLRRLLDDPGALAEVAAKALDIAHFRRDGTDEGHAPRARERCERACYDCLLSYGNLRYHRQIDRHSARDLLLRLAASRVESGGSGTGRADHLQQLAGGASPLAAQLLRWLDEHDYRLPTDAGTLIPEANAHADFIYLERSGQTAVFVDDPRHSAGLGGRDTSAERRLRFKGWTVVRFSVNDAEWHRVAALHPSVFGAGRT